jgi:dipeptidyl aminopeptidase/acylaminoacyl peptidase
MAIKQPKMQQTIGLRAALALFAVAALLYGMYRLRDWGGDPGDGGPHVDTAGWIAAVKQVDDGNQMVVIKPDGQIVESAKYTPGKNDHDPAWQPDGQRLLFSSNRDIDENALHIYRWNLSTNGIDERSRGRIAQEHPTYQVDGTVQPPYSALIISGGVVVQFDPKEERKSQLLPIETSTPTQSDEGAGMGTQFGPEYERLGISFREAQWCKGGEFIAGIMRREGGGETLVIQSVTEGQGMADTLPHGLVAGDHLDMSIDPKTGNIICAVQGFQFIDPSHVPSEFVKNGRAVKPYAEALIDFDPDNPKNTQIIDASPTPGQAFAQPAVSPDGSRVVFNAGSIASGAFTSAGLATEPLAADGRAGLAWLEKMGIATPSWSPDGRHIVFISIAKNDVCTIGPDGANRKDLTNGSGIFSTPVYSPMTSTAGS